MVITNLPAETIDHIAAALDSPTDLRNLAAVCTQLRSLLVPHHTQFRIIRAPLLSPIWKKLAENRLFAQNVRLLEIQCAEIINGDDESVIPAIFHELEVPSVPVPDDDGVDDDAIRSYEGAKNAMDLNAERILVSALKGMSGLTLFQWTRTPPLINRDQEDDIWITLAKYCTSLNVIDVMDRAKPSKFALQQPDDPAYQRPIRNPNFYLFRDLKSFLFSTEAFNVGNFACPDVEQFAQMLIGNCPNLEVLTLEYWLFGNPDINSVPASPLLSGPPWTSLRELALFGFDFDSTDLSSFLASHPTIEILSLTYSHIDQSLVLLPGTLPRLKQISADMGSTVINSVLDSNISTPRPLKHIVGPLPNGVFLDSLGHSGSGPNLEKLITVCSSDLDHLIMRLSGIAPNLEWLDFNQFSSPEIFDRSLYTVLSQLPRLQTLRGVRFLDSNCDPASENTEAIRALVTACPNLQRISWYIGNLLDTDSGVIIERNGSHVTWSLRKKLRDGEGSFQTAWGERGCVNKLYTYVTPPGTVEDLEEFSLAINLFWK